MPKKSLISQETINIGEENIIFSESPDGRFQTVFEDDGDTRYFYGMDKKKTDARICDAVHIYDVKSITDKNIPSKIGIMWLDDSLKSALLINDYLYAVFDFFEHRGYCRTNFSPSGKNWTDLEHEWTDDILNPFK